MRGLKTLNLRFLEIEYNYIVKGKLPGESWETYIIRIASVVKGRPS